MLATTAALIHGHRQIDPRLNDPDLLLVKSHRQPPELVGWYGLGNSVLAVPGFVAGSVVDRLSGDDHHTVRRLAVASTNSLVTAATAVIVMLLALELGAGRRGALVVAVGFAVGTFAWGSSKTFFSEPATGLCLAGATLLAIRAARRRQPWLLTAMGGALGIGLQFRTSLGVAIPIVVAYGLLVPRPSHRREFLVRFGHVAAGLGAALVLLALVQWWRFGNPFELGYPPPLFDTPLLRGAYGLLASPGVGLLWYAPPVFVAIGAAFLVRRERLPEIALLLAPLALTTLFFARWHGWEGGGAFGPRYLLPVVPVACAAAALAWWHPTVRRAFIAATVVGVVLPGIIGVTTYFNTATIKASPSVIAHDKAANLKTLQGIRRFLDHYNFDPHYAPLILQAQDFGEAVANTTRRLAGQDRSLSPPPLDPKANQLWFASSLQIDTWWAWWPAENGPQALLLLAVCEALVGIVSARRLAILVLRSEPSSRCLSPPLPKRRRAVTSSQRSRALAGRDE